MVTNKKSLNAGIVLTVSFLLTLIILFQPVINGQTAVEFADNMFNSFAKGSTYFIPEIQKASREFTGQKVDIKLDMKEAEAAVRTAELLAGAGAEVEQDGSVITASGDLGLILASSLKDADAVFNGNSGEVTNRYSCGAREAMYNWWLCFREMEKAFQREGNFQKAFIAGEVIKKAIEPAYNFYGMESKNVKDYSGTLIGLLSFYVIYTLWWGFAIYFLFEGLGITMTKAGKKAEI